MKTGVLRESQFWLRWDLNLGLPIEKPVLYPLLHKLMLLIIISMFNDSKGFFFSWLLVQLPLGAAEELVPSF
jgi:hypothetical protein